MRPKRNTFGVRGRGGTGHFDKGHEVVRGILGKAIGKCFAPKALHLTMCLQLTFKGEWCFENPRKSTNQEQQAE
jgi:hypothetical protein